MTAPAVGAGKVRTRRWDKRSGGDSEIVGTLGDDVLAESSLPVSEVHADLDDDGFWETSDSAETKVAQQSMPTKGTGNIVLDADANDLPMYYGSALRALHSQQGSHHQDDAERSGKAVGYSATDMGSTRERGSKSKGSAKGKRRQQKDPDLASEKMLQERPKRVPRATVGQPRHQHVQQRPSPANAKAFESELSVRDPITSTEHKMASGAVVTSASRLEVLEENVELDAELAALRNEERESLEAIYGPEFEEISSNEWLVRLEQGAAMRIYLPIMYPREEPPMPVFELEHGVEPLGLMEQLLDQWTAGEACVYQWIEKVRAELEHGAAHVKETPVSSFVSEHCESDEALARILEADERAPIAFDAEAQELYDGFTYNPATTQYGQRRRIFGSESGDSRHSVEIVHGEPLIDRKSIFQAHLARVTCVEQVHWVHRQLLSDKKIAAATHNIVAYRFRDEVRGLMVSDNDDDGETAAGGRLAELLSLRGAEGVFVMVSRWYGGIQLGPDRFKDINRAAQLLLDSAGLSKHSGAGTTSSKTSRKGRTA